MSLLVFQHLHSCIHLIIAIVAQSLDLAQQKRDVLTSVGNKFRVVHAFHTIGNRFGRCFAKEYSRGAIPFSVTPWPRRRRFSAFTNRRQSFVNPLFVNHPCISLARQQKGGCYPPTTEAGRDPAVSGFLLTVATSPGAVARPSRALSGNGCGRSLHNWPYSAAWRSVRKEF